VVAAGGDNTAGVVPSGADRDSLRAAERKSLTEAAG